MPSAPPLPRGCGTDPPPAPPISVRTISKALDSYGRRAGRRMVFASPAIATVYGGLALIVCNSISTWLGWPELSLPWWPQRPGRAAVTISSYIIAGWLGVFIGVIAFVWYYARQ